MLKKISFWVGLILAIIGPILMLGTWFYFNQTELVPYVKSYVPAGAVVSIDDIEFRKVRLPDLPEGYMTRETLEAEQWRALDGLTSTDPLTVNKLTNKRLLEVKPGQVITSFPFTNTGLLTFLEPGDHISIIDTTKTLDDILVLGKYDKEAKLVSLLPELQGVMRKEAQGLITSINQQEPAAQAPATLLLLVTTDQAMELTTMSKGLVTLTSREGLFITEITDAPESEPEITDSPAIKEEEAQ